MENLNDYQIMLNHLIGALMGHIDNEMKFTFKQSDVEGFDVIEEIKKLNSTDFASFGCRIQSFKRVLENFEGYFEKNKELLPGAYENYKALEAVSDYYDMCANCMKKEGNK